MHPPGHNSHTEKQEEQQRPDIKQRRKEQAEHQFQPREWEELKFRHIQPLVCRKREERQHNPEAEQSAKEQVEHLGIGRSRKVLKSDKKQNGEVAPDKKQDKNTNNR